MDVWGVCQGDEPSDAARIAALAWQLPRSSRTWSAHEPDGAYDASTLMLRQIEYDVRSFHWMLSEDGKNKKNEPEPFMLPGEELALEKAEERAESDAMELARAFGMIS